MSNFAMGTILGKGFPQAQVHTNHSTSAEGTSAVMYARKAVCTEISKKKCLHICQYVDISERK